jgi:hypothetical protein
MVSKAKYDIVTPDFDIHAKLNDYLIKLSDRNMIKFYLEEIHDISLKGNPKDIVPNHVRKKLYKLGIITKTTGCGGRVVVNWDRVWAILG